MQQLAACCCLQGLALLKRGMRAQKLMLPQGQLRLMSLLAQSLEQGHWLWMVRMQLVQMQVELVQVVWMRMEVRVVEVVVEQEVGSRAAEVRR